MLLPVLIRVDTRVRGEAAAPRLFGVEGLLVGRDALVEKALVVLCKLEVLGVLVVYAGIEALRVVGDLVSELAFRLAVGQMVQDAVEHDGVGREVFFHVLRDRGDDVEVADGQLFSQSNEFIARLIIPFEKDIEERLVLDVVAYFLSAQ